MATKDKIDSKGKGCKSGVKNYKIEQLLTIIGNRLPVDTPDWIAVAERYISSNYHNFFYI